MNFQEQLELQKEVVAKLRVEHAEKPSKELAARIIREHDLMKHFQNAAKGDAAGRARKAAMRAKRTVDSLSIA